MDDRLGRLLRVTIAPALKERGFSRRAERFFMHRDSCWGLIDFEKSLASTSTGTKFTVNVGVASDLLRRFLTTRAESKAPRLTDCQWRVRLGELLPGGEDKWWTLEDFSDWQALGNELCGYLCNVATPQIEALMSDRALMDLWLTGRSPGLTEVQRLKYLSVLLKALGPQSELERIRSELLRVSQGKPTAGMVRAHLGRLERWSDG